jgi:D-glycero-D-manno-heptose 1,7-bisphosphate phosphatase
MSLGRGDRAVFLDRDGTLIEDEGYVRDVNAVRLIEGAAAALRQLKASGFRLIVASNQSGIGRGIITPDQARAVHDRLVLLLAERGAAIDGALYCPHAPGAGCLCRKPLPGLILEGARRYVVDASSSFMVGDAVRDAEAGVRAGCRAVQLMQGQGEVHPGAALASSWPEVVDLILAREESECSI